MKRLIQVGAVALSFLSFTGCIATKVTEPSEGKMRQVSVTTNVVGAKVSKVKPSISREGGVVAVEISLLGKFTLEEKKFFVSTLERDDYLAAGFFPGVMSCRGEYRECLQNGASAFLCNLAFGCLPTVYGLLVEPFVPHYPEQTDSIIGRKAFLKSALIGFSRYSKPAEIKEKVSTFRREVKELPLEDAFIEAPELGIASERGLPLRIPEDKLPSSGTVGVKLRLPDDHPLKDVMAVYKDVTIPVSCKK